MNDIPTPAHLFQKGQIANPHGRNGTRAKLATRFFKDLYAAWEEQGDAAELCHHCTAWETGA